MKVCFTEHDQMVKALAPYRADQTLHVGVLPGRPPRGWSIPDTQRTQASPHDLAIDGVSISHQISRRRVPWERLGDLPGNPRRRRMRRDRVVNKLPPAVRHEHQTVEQLETDRRHDE